MNEARTGLPRTSGTKDSPSRQAVRAMLAQSMKPRQIAQAMGISVEAVRRHVRAIREEEA